MEKGRKRDRIIHSFIRKSKSKAPQANALIPQTHTSSSTRDTANTESLVVPSSTDGVPTKDLWANALSELSEEDRSTISSGKESKVDSIQRLLEAAKGKKQQYEARKWVFQFNGKSIVLSDIAAKIVVWVNKFKEVGDVAVNFDPVHAALPWAGFRFLLQVRFNS